MSCGHLIVLPLYVKFFCSEDRAANVLLSLCLARGGRHISGRIDTRAFYDVHALMDIDINVSVLLFHVVSLLDIETSLA